MGFGVRVIVYGPTSQAIDHLLEKKKMMMKSQYLTLMGCSSNAGIPCDHSGNTERYLKSGRMQAFESFEAFYMYYAIVASVSKSTDSLIE